MADLISSSSFLSNGSEETLLYAKEFAKKLSRGSVICLTGDLGAGKTTFAKGFISELTELKETMIQSPTFIYLNTYDTKNGTLCHFDVYRIPSPREFETMGFLDYFDGETVCLIEWGETISTLLPPKTIYINIKYVDIEKRLITIEQHL